ncbi:MAG: SAM-dependent DNA methyltransferase [Bacteroidetes bacterium]|jgi:type I restriction enzyme M protein|nr:SAM-dependent DNA methyltransferase [Bacteroidota bacterium]MBT6686754.1 SAM-dependent DNA methyltransferase [Bacteroidota bacterium]MBT7144188.1 SAM-dependent DNA methyltransferase [Bacteroidota bacterium]MBT7491571.1 SAM-dependent DNA methyltransferase [Bacteroidota bacterium]
MTDSSIISKIWNLAGVLRDDGVGYGDYLEQITYLLFLKMADELNKPPYNKGLQFPRIKDVEGKEIADGETCDWETLSSKRGAELESFYSQLLRSLSTEKGMLGQIFTKSQNKIQDPAKLSRVINMIDQEQWSMMGADIKGKIYEGLLEKNAEDTKSGAGQYFTPRALIKTMVACVQPKPMKTISDPACGTGGFFLAAYDWIVANNQLDREEKEFIKNDTFHGNEIVANTRRMCLMNMYLHNIGEIDGMSFISSNDALVSDEGSRYDYVLANPPFGKKSSMTITNEQGEAEKEDLSYNRQDFWETTSNKQLNFLQHIKTQLKITGEAAVVLPDNVLFEGGAGEEVRKQLMLTTDLHTILRLPTGLFYAHGVKANVLFFDNKAASKEAQTKEVWIYDYRTNIHHTLKKKQMSMADLADFVKLYNPDNRHKRTETWSEENPDGRWRKYAYEEILARDKTNLDIFWLKDKSLTDLDNLPDPDILANEIIENLESGLNSFKGIMATINGQTE